MSTLNIPSKKKVVVPFEQIEVGDVVYLSDKDSATPYSVLQKGAPFILIENLKTHFGSLYRPTLIYKEV